MGQKKYSVHLDDPLVPSKVVAFTVTSVYKLKSWCLSGPQRDMFIRGVSRKVTIHILDTPKDCAVTYAIHFTEALILRQYACSSSSTLNSTVISSYIVLKA
jgi:hypothetical protein